MISLLGSEIGRGHPFYTDGLRAALHRAGRADLVARDTDVFRVSRGTSRLAWRAARAAYTWAGRGGIVSVAYHAARRGADHDRDGWMTRRLGRDLRAWAGSRGIVVADHPAVVGALGDRADTWYLHGEMVAPREAVVRRAARILVPLPETADAFAAAGVERERLIVTGVCVEEPLREGADAGTRARRERIRGDAPLTVAFFSSGAEPPRHVAALAAAAVALGNGRHRALVFAAEGGSLQRAVVSARAAEVVAFRTREDLDRCTARHFAGVDAVVSPPHERSNWAVGLGVPFFLVGPDIGPFAPRNRELLLARGVARELAPEDARDLSGLLDSMRASGELLGMAERGGGVSLRGFDTAAAALIAAAERERRGHGPAEG
jgi:hypothetical protein